MFDKELTEHQNRIASAGSKSQERKTALQTGVEFADDTIKRLDADAEHTAGEYRRRKAAWGRHVDNDEKPREVREQTFASRIFRVAGLCAIGIEVGIMTYILHRLFEAYGLPFAASLALALILAIITTIPIAYLIHGAIYYLVTRPAETAAQLKRLTIYFIALPLLFVIVSMAAYVAVFRLDADTLYALQAVLSAAKFVAMFGFVIAGAGLLVAADLFGWSRSRAATYKAILDERQAIASKRREWQEELAAFTEQKPTEPTTATPVGPPAAPAPAPAAPALANGNSAEPTPAPPGGPAPVPAPAPAASPNGNSAVTMLATMLMLLGSVGGLSACSPPSPKVTMTPVQEEVVCDVAFDASGKPDGDGDGQRQEEARQVALRQAGFNVVESVRKTIEREHVTKLNVFWAGGNGWMLEEKLALSIPPYKRVELIRRDAGEFDNLRPDVAEVDRRRNEKVLADATARASTDYHGEVEKALAQFTAEAVVPPPTVSSPCTDIDGMLARFSAPTSAVRRVLYLVTDGRQSCGSRSTLRKVVFPENTAILIVLIPGAETDGHGDFEQRKAMFKEACARCEVEPFFRANLDEVVAKAFKMTNIPSAANAKK